MQQFEVYDNSQKLEGQSAKGDGIKGILNLGVNAGSVFVKVGISPVSSRKRAGEYQC